jgi:hypothetical protein
VEHLLARPIPAPLVPGVELDERPARASLRRQIAKLERDLADALSGARPGDVGTAPGVSLRGPRLLDLGELERVRDALSDRLAEGRRRIAERADSEAAARVLLERVLLDPGRHRRVRITQAELGEPGCGVYQVRPRLGLVGMLAGWWQVKLSSGCPLATGPRGARPGDRSAPGRLSAPAGAGAPAATPSAPARTIRRGSG